MESLSITNHHHSQILFMINLSEHSKLQHLHNLVGRLWGPGSRSIDLWFKAYHVDKLVQLDTLEASRAPC